MHNDDDSAMTYVILGTLCSSKYPSVLSRFCIWPHSTYLRHSALVFQCRNTPPRPHITTLPHGGGKPGDFFAFFAFCCLFCSQIAFLWNDEFVQKQHRNAINTNWHHKHFFKNEKTSIITSYGVRDQLHILNFLFLIQDTSWPVSELLHWKCNFPSKPYIGTAVAEWLSRLRSKRTGVRFPASPLEFSEIGYLLLPSRDMAEIPLKRRKSSIQPNNLNHIKEALFLWFICSN